MSKLSLQHFQERCETYHTGFSTESVNLVIVFDFIYGR